MEVTLIEMWLFAWAIGATSLWLDARHDARKAKFVLHHLIENDEARDMIVSDFKKLKQQGKQNAT